MAAWKQTGKLILWAAILALTPASLHASTVTFSYSAPEQNLDGNSYSSTGSGSFSFNGAPSSITLGDLTSFSFSDAIIEYSLRDNSVLGTFNTSYDLADLVSFAAALQGGVLTALDLQTNPLETSSAAGSGEIFFQVSGLTEGADVFPGSTDSEPPFGDGQEN